MKLQHCMWASLTALLLAGVLVLDTDASGRRGGGVSPGVHYYGWPDGAGGGLGMPYGAAGVWYYPYGPVYPYYSNPYIMPYPAYGILPPPFATWNYMGYDPFNPKHRMTTQRALGDTETPRKRSSLYPAVPFDAAPGETQKDTSRATFLVTVPKADAVIIFDGGETKQQGLKRRYQTPPLEAGKTYSYLVEGIWRDEAGKQVWRKEQRTFKAGETVSIDFK